MGMGEWDDYLIISSDYGSFPHSLLSTSKTMTFRITLTKEAISFRRLLWVIHEEEDFLGVENENWAENENREILQLSKTTRREILWTTKPSILINVEFYSFIDTLPLVNVHITSWKDPPFFVAGKPP